MVVVMIVIMAMTVTQQQRTDDIHHQADDGNQRRCTELHLGGFQQAHHRLDRNAQGYQRQDQRRGEAAQVADLAGAETEARAARMALGIGVGRRSNAQGAGVGGHVETVGQQGHGTGEIAGGDFRHHHHQRQQHHPQGAPGVFFVG